MTRGPGLLALQLVRVVGAEQGDVVAVAGGELAQPLLVGLAGLAVGGVQVLEEAQPGWAAGWSLKLAVVEVGVAAVQEPAVVRLAAPRRVWPREWPNRGISSTSASRPGRMRTLSKPSHSSPPLSCLTQRGPCCQWTFG